MRFSGRWAGAVTRSEDNVHVYSGRFPRALLFWKFLDLDLAEAHHAMIALEEDRPRLSDVLVDLAARRPVADHVVVNLLAVQNHGDLVPDDRRLDGLPLVAGFG